jgi:hypothetical protein
VRSARTCGRCGASEGAARWLWASKNIGRKRMKG